MAISEFYRSLRGLLGTRLLLMPAVAAIIRDQDGRVLLQQKHDLSWSLPAGAIEPGETPAEAAIREVFEETGLHVQPVRLAAVVGGQNCRVRYENGDEVEYLVTVFECDIRSGTLDESNEESRCLAHFRADEMPTLAFQFPKEIFESSGGSSYFLDPTTQQSAVD